MIHIDLPYDYGTFVRVKDENGNIPYCGTVSAYTLASTGFLIWVSGYKQPYCGEYQLEEIELMNKSEIEELIKSFE